ncbi:preprotein translocase subunit YajC [Citroniella saccharovorans]|uniref:Preprotein translocase subunit YajC n=1 Tax=Citroniella saccharovorans TaxID=2053367 RepID=A0AAW9MRN9_9FIRM|nr:preprotein translocase subunit YajC [Citroniella saccharovorans]MEB3429741.1 preprotein translocase subunit YajC [Citroniella saccharovorans]
MPEGITSIMPTFLSLIIAFVIIYFLMIKPQKKREKEIQAIRDGVKVGDNIITVGGIKGKVTKTGEDYITIKSQDAQMEVTRTAIYKVIEK